MKKTISKFFGNFADTLREADKFLLFLCMSASVFGCFVIFSATQIAENNRQTIMQVSCLAGGVIIALILSRIDYKKLAKLWWLIASTATMLVVLTFFIGYAPVGTDDKAWLSFAGFSFQPAELLKIAFAVTFPLHLSKIKGEINTPKNLILLALHGAFPVLLIHFQGDDGTAMIFAIMFICMIFAAGLNKKLIVLGGAGIAVMLPISWFFLINEDQKKRFLSLLNPEADLLGDGWQQWRARIALASGNWFGKGYLNGPNVKSGAIPEGYNDFIFASLGEEFGFVTGLLLVLLLVGICLRVLWVASKTTDDLGKYMCIGLFAMLSSNIIINLGMCLSLLPVVGVTLPFISAGGTNLVCLFMGVGLVLSAYSHREQTSIYIR